MNVSVIIPTYNRADLVTDAINSVLQQSYQDFEIIVIDDGSTDNTSKVLKTFGDRIRYIKQKNMGAGAARNRGLKEANGRYIAFLDSDDIWLDFKLELQVAVLERIPEAGFLSSEFYILKESGKTISSGLRTWYKEPVPWEHVYEKGIRYPSLKLPAIAPKEDFTIYIGNLYHPLLREPYVLPSSAIIRRDCLKPDIKFAEGVALYEDWEFFARFAKDNAAVFLDIETTFNRGHIDEVRLTHCSTRTKAECRLGMIEHVWEKDAAFMETYGNDVKTIENEQLTILARCQLFDSQIENARETLKKLKYTELKKGRLELSFLKCFAYFPGGDKILILMRNLRRLFFMVKKGLTMWVARRSM